MSEDSYWNPSNMIYGDYWNTDTPKADINAIMQSGNLYAYCSGNPVKFIDPSGFKIELSSSATEEEKQEYERATTYLKTSKDGKDLIEKLENSEEVFTIMFVENGNDLYLPSTREICWDIQIGLVMSNGTSVFSPAVALAHEMGHGAQHLDGELNDYFKSPSQSGYDKIEEANVKKHETPIAKQLGEPIRTSYYNHKGTQKMNNSIHFITTHSYGITFYLNPFNWGKSDKYIKNHNIFPILGTTINPAN